MCRDTVWVFHCRLWSWWNNTENKCKCWREWGFVQSGTRIAVGQLQLAVPVRNSIYYSCSLSGIYMCYYVNLLMLHMLFTRIILAQINMNLLINLFNITSQLHRFHIQQSGRMIVKIAIWVVMLISWNHLPYFRDTHCLCHIYLKITNTEENVYIIILLINSSLTCCCKICNDLHLASAAQHRVQKYCITRTQPIFCVLRLCLDAH